MSATDAIVRIPSLISSGEKSKCLFQVINQTLTLSHQTDEYGLLRKLRDEIQHGWNSIAHPLL